MSFYNVMENYTSEKLRCFIENVKPEDVRRVLARNRLSEFDYLTLLSPAASDFLEDMAKKAHEITVRQFGKTILMYTPMYLSDHCVNLCRYCGFNASVSTPRGRLELDDIGLEAEAIAKTGLKHILVLTGESRVHSSPEYMKNCVKRLLKYFSSVSIEVYPLEKEEYVELVKEGVEGLTLYQETYNEELYDHLHLKGPKKNYMFRLDAPERGCISGMRTVNIGALLGLDIFYRDVFYTGLHAAYLQRRYPEVDISVSFPRMRPHNGLFQPEHPVTDRQMVQVITALRIFMPRAGITLSTRETEDFRNNVLPLGITKMSAGSCTKVGGRVKEGVNDGQFDISDKRSVEEMAGDLAARGYQPVYKDWENFFSTSAA